MAEEKPWTDQFLEQFEEIKTRISKIEQAQKDTLAEKDKILAEVDRTRVWARHSGNRGGAHA